MGTLYRIVARTPSGKTFEPNAVFDRAAAACKVRELNERYSYQNYDYVAQAVNLLTLPSWQLADLFQAGKISYGEVQEILGSEVAQLILKRSIARNSSGCR